MYNRYICPLQPCTHFTLKLLIQGHPQSAKVTHIADFKSAYTVEPLLSDPLLSEFSIIQPPVHSPNSI